MSAGVSLRAWFLAAVVLLIAAAPKAHAVPFQWSGRVAIDNPRANTGSDHRITALDCPTASLCVVGDSQGNLYASDDPIGGLDAWSVTAVASGQMRDISCPDPGFCVAVSGTKVFTSTDPVGGDWQTTEIDGVGRGYGLIECPSRSLCIASDEDGYITSFDSPTVSMNNMHRWKVSTSPLNGLSCPTVHLCVGTTSVNHILSSSNPSQGPAAWHTIDTNLITAEHVTCPTETFCAVSDQTGRYATSTNPTGDYTAWDIQTPIGIDGHHPMICTSSTFCIATEWDGNVYTTHDPAGGGSTWARQKVTDQKFNGNSIACPTSSFCLTSDFNDEGEVLTSTNPSGGLEDWDPTNFRYILATPLLGTSCPTPSLCLAVDGDGTVISTTTLTGYIFNGMTRADLSGRGAGFFLGISCTATPFCAAVDASGHVASSGNPTGGPGAWRVDTIDPGHALYGVACPSASLCVAVDDAGRLLSSTSPGGGAWRVATVDAGRALTAVACASAELCVAVDDDGRTLVSTAPAGGAGAWSSNRIDPGAALEGVSCPSASMCVAVDSEGRALSSIDPADPAFPWQTVSTGGSFLTAVACSSASLCTATDIDGDILTSTAPAGGNWTIADQLDAPLATVACSGIAVCAAGDLVGDWDIGHGTMVAFNTVQPAILGTPAAGSRTTCSTGTWSGDTPTFSYHWHRGGAEIPGATSKTYTVQAADQGSKLSCWVTATTSWGQSTANSRTFPVPYPPSARAPQPVVPKQVPEVVAQRVTLAALLAHGLPLSVNCEHACRLSVMVLLDARSTKKLRLKRGRDRHSRAILGSVSITLGAMGHKSTSLRLSSSVKRKLGSAHLRRITLSVVTIERATKRVTGTRTLTISASRSRDPH